MKLSGSRCGSVQRNAFANRHATCCWVIEIVFLSRDRSKGIAQVTNSGSRNAKSIMAGNVSLKNVNLSDWFNFWNIIKINSSFSIHIHHIHHRYVKLIGNTNAIEEIMKTLKFLCVFRVVREYRRLQISTTVNRLPQFWFYQMPGLYINDRIIGLTNYD